VLFMIEHEYKQVSDSQSIMSL